MEEQTRGEGFGSRGGLWVETRGGLRRHILVDDVVINGAVAYAKGGWGFGGVGRGGGVGGVGGVGGWELGTWEAMGVLR